MPNENDSNTPSANPDKQSVSQAPVTPSAVQESEMRKGSDGCTGTEESKTIQIEKDIRSGERWLIGISAASVVINVVIAVIYYGQLKEMRKATQAAADAAITATDALKENKRQFGETSTATRQQFAETLKQMIAQTDSQRRSVATAQEANALTQKSLEDQTRPWVGFEIGSITGQYVAPNGQVPYVAYVLKYKVQDYGNSPALHVAIRYSEIGTMGPTFASPDMTVCVDAKHATEHASEDPMGISTEALFPRAPVEKEQGGSRRFTADQRYILCAAYQGTSGKRTYITVLQLIFNPVFNKNLSSGDAVPINGPTIQSVETR